MSVPRRGPAKIFREIVDHFCKTGCSRNNKETRLLRKVGSLRIDEGPRQAMLPTPLARW